jgi:hypothetical protein
MKRTWEAIPVNIFRLDPISQMYGYNEDHVTEFPDSGLQTLVLTNADNE